MSEDRHLNYEQAAAILGVCRQTLKTYRDRGFVQAVHVGPTRIRFRESEIRALLNGCQPVANPE